MSPIRVFEKYEIIRRLTSGGMGDIFLARQVGVAGFQRLVILKSMRPELVENEDLLAQFLNEARTIARLNHPNIVGVIEVDEYRGVFFIAMEYIEGADLSSLLTEARRAKQPIPFRVSAGMVHDAAMGLAHAHAAKDDEGRALSLVHRDISPANVMVRLDGISKVLDFGIATMIGSGPLRGMIQGKYRYMSPEQALGRELTPASDQFSLGIVLWELCTQRRLFSDQEPAKILRQVVEAKIPPPSQYSKHIPRELEATIMRMLQRDAAQRFPSCKHVVDALRAYLEGSGGPADRNVEHFFQALLGEEVRARTRDLTPEAVTIAGLLQTADILCASCQYQNKLRHRFCAQCGAPLYAGPSQSPDRTPVKPALTPSPAKSISRQSVHTLLLDRGAELMTRTQVQRDAPAVMLAARIHGRQRIQSQLSKAAARNLDQRLTRIYTSAAESFDGAIIRLTAEDLVLAFAGARTLGDDALRALRCATELEEELRRAARSQQLPLAISIGLARGKMALGATAASRDGGVKEAMMVATTFAARDQSGIYAVDTLADALESMARFSATEDSNARKLSYVVGESPGERIALVGRTMELARAREVLRACAGGEPRALLFSGTPGIGKTRMLHEVAVAASKRGFRIARISCAPGEGEDAPDLLASVLPPGEKLVTKPAIRARIIALAAEKPMLILADDLHLAGDQLWAELGALFSAAGSAALAIIGAAGGLARETPAFIQETIELAPLTDDKILAVAQAFADGLVLPPVAGQLVLERAGGNPGSARLVVEALVAGGGLVRDGEHWTATPELTTIDLAARFQDLLEARITQLAPPARRFLELGAVVGASFDGAIAAKLLKTDAEKIIALAVETGFVARVDASSLRFEQASYRDALLARLSPEQVKLAHERWGRALSEAGGSVAAIATHLLSGEAELDSVPLALRAATELTGSPRAVALVRGAFHACAARLKAGATPTPELIAALKAYGPSSIAILAAHELGEGADLYGLIEGSVSGKIDPATEASLLHQRAKLYLTQGRIQEAGRDLKHALSLADRGGDDAVRAKVLAASAEVHEARGELDAAVAQVIESLQIAQNADAGRDFLWTQSNALGRLYMRMNDAERAEELFNVAAEQAIEAESDRGQAAALSNQASVCAKSGRTERALELLASAITFAERAGDTVGYARASYNRGRILAHKGRADEARDALTASVRAAVEGGWTEGEALGRRALESLADQAKRR